METQNLEVDLTSYPKTVDQWWAWLEHDWVNVLNIFDDFIKDRKTFKQLVEFKTTKDTKIVSLLETCWNNIPENNQHIGSKTWCILSELISEIDLLERDSTKQETININSSEQETNNMTLFRKRHHHLLDINMV